MNLLAFDFMPYLTGLAVVWFVLISVLMMLVVLIQRPQGGGLSGAFGGGGGEGAGQTAFGAKTGDVLTTVTVGVFVVFLLSAIGLNHLVRPRPAIIDPPMITAPIGDDQTSDADAATGDSTVSPPLTGATIVTPPDGDADSQPAEQGDADPAAADDPADDDS